MTKTATKEAPVVRETIEEIRNKKSPLMTRANKTWPAMYEIYRAEGGMIPSTLDGMYTSQTLAADAIAAHLG